MVFQLMSQLGQCLLCQLHSIQPWSARWPIHTPGRINNQRNVVVSGGVYNRDLPTTVANDDIIATATFNGVISVSSHIERRRWLNLKWPISLVLIGIAKLVISYHFSSHISRR